ncbi:MULTISPECIES: LacI family DNA-binding transcriptional regulator [Streptococcus]|uniref:LacI family DNA-binding transcriptional regulator n=1 Tax=Streptococcus taonis TaxID=3041623 RepID=A0ABT6PDQ4_9STRE|nr:LacI family DNA-binding transcriptional regulator [Streptococcus sp. ST22-14]MDI1474128.1 LacI family DNA-binding transcriptional regulator [Streptococcus sp. ST22-14]
MPVTIKDVAKAAGVSPSTVTRVIQNKSTISDETKKRVRKTMKELNYHPNLNARSLVSSYTQVIGLVLPDDSDAFYQNPFFPSVLRGIAQVASENHYAIQIATGKDEKERLNAISQMVYGKRVDGLIFLYAQENDPLVKLVSEEQFPFLILGKSLSPFIPLVDNDNIQAGFDATEYFIKKGCNRIAFIGGAKKLYVTQDRLTGYEQALQEHKLPLDSQRTFFADEFLEEKGYKFSKRLFKHDPQTDAIITTDSLLAEGVCNYLNDHNLNIPVLSFDSVNPRLNLAAYVDINSLSLGRTSFETILQIISDTKENRQICYRQVIAHKIVEK